MDEDFADSSVIASEEWNRSAADGELDREIDNRLMVGDEAREGGGLAVHSLSGKERNHLFINQNTGEQFTDLSALSGLDSISDSRCFALLDYDRDGWQDIALVNANQPLLQLFHNDITEVSASGGGMIAVRFVGANTTAAPSPFTARDGYGAMVEVALSGSVNLVREHRCGEGFAAQNSSTMIVGIGDRASVESLSVRWPSGKIHTLENVAEGTLVTAFENRAAGAFTQEPYRNGRSRSVPPAAGARKFPIAGSGAGKIQVYTTTATWCAACVGHLPALTRLNQDGVALYGVPIDPEDDAAKLGEYVEKREPPYEMLVAIDDGEKQAVSEFFARELGVPNPVLPSSVITDADGNVLEVMQGIPTLSQVRKWMALQ
ncbi:MAG: ASPIC/UnbV domain-containing protein [Verrucomicrobiales bacterium]